MSLFYGNKEEGNLNPHPQSQNQDPTFKKKQQGNSSKQKDHHSQQSILLAKQPEKQPGYCDKCCDNCCPCLSLNYYKDHFKVTNQDVLKRIGCNLKFWSGGFFQPKEQDYDLYGPFWLYTTMIFVVTAVHNILIYHNSQDQTSFTYDFQSFWLACTAFYGLGFILSAIIGLMFGCCLESKTSQIVCLYGYSMVNYIICVLICSINITLATWCLLIYASATKVIYILRNIYSLEVPTAKKFMITLIVIIEAALQFLIIKFGFIKTSKEGGIKAAFSHMAVDHESNGFHLRHFMNF